MDSRFLKVHSLLREGADEVPQEANEALREGADEEAQEAHGANEALREGADEEAQEAHGEPQEREKTSAKRAISPRSPMNQQQLAITPGRAMS